MHFLYISYNINSSTIYLLNLWYSTLVILFVVVLYSDTCFDSTDYIGRDWEWVGTGREGKATALPYIQNYKDGPTNVLYLGVIFDGKEQLGFAATKIEACISATPAVPPARFNPSFDVNEALVFAELSQLAYSSYSEIKDLLPKKFNLKADMEIYDSFTDTNGFIASNDKYVAVVFRGTNSFRNFIVDTVFMLKPVDKDKEYYAHYGFVTALEEVFGGIEKEIQPYIGKKKLFITGHSLGGALATLTTYRISSMYKNALPVQYVYGCPPVGDFKLANYFSVINSNTITIQNDPISSGTLISLGPWVNLYKPVQVMYLPKAAGHGIADYIKQLQNLN